MENEKKFLFRFEILFNSLPPYISSQTFTDRHACCAACRDLIAHIKKTRPDLAMLYRSWTYHGWADGQTEPAWR